MLDYEKTFAEFWAADLLLPDGTLDKDKVMRELHDYRMVLDEVSKVYDNITGGRFSKPLTEAVHVIAAADEYYESLHKSETVEG